MKLSDNILLIINMLELEGLEAYVVGGCVRDFLLGNKPKDYDVTTSAKPEQVISIFSKYRVIESGIKHGTVTVVIGGESVEITTFRIDGKYSDNRRPDSVTFTGNLKDDIFRRDFTINAIAFNPRQGIVDLCGGIDDLKNGIIRCVGDPKKRFEEDSLRILRGLRFASRFGFSIESNTNSAMHELKNLLKNIAVERINVEFSELICGECEDILRNYVDVIGVFIPEILPCVGFLQHTKYHNKDVYEHIIASVVSIEPKLEYRLTMFFHDIGKPHRFSMKNNVGHFYGHGTVSTEIAEAVMKRMKYNTKIIEKVLLLVKYHDLTMQNNEVGIKKQLNKFGEENFFDLIKVHIADNMGKAEKYAKRNKEFLELTAKAREILDEESCFTLGDLAVRGGDISKLGLYGEDIGKALKLCLDAVIENKCENNKQELLDFIRTSFT